MKTIEDFKRKHEKLIKLGVISFSESDIHYIVTIDRFDGYDFLCEAKELNSPRADIKKLGYTLRMNIGEYMKRKDGKPYPGAFETLREILSIHGFKFESNE